MNLPNKLTIFRMVLVPVIILICIFPFKGEWVILGASLPIYQFVVVILFGLASLTDFFDGHIARCRNIVTTFGKFMDPIADKLLVNSLLLVLTYTHHIHVIIPLIMISRDLVVDAIRLLASQNNVVLAASNLGKAKTFTQMFGISFVLLNNIPFHLMGVRIDLAVMIIATIISLISGADYFMKNKGFILESM